MRLQLLIQTFGSSARWSPWGGIHPLRFSQVEKPGKIQRVMRSLSTLVLIGDDSQKKVIRILFWIKMWSCVSTNIPGPRAQKQWNQRCQMLTLYCTGLWATQLTNQLAADTNSAVITHPSSSVMLIMCWCVKLFSGQCWGQTTMQSLWWPYFLLMLLSSRARQEAHLLVGDAAWGRTLNTCQSHQCNAWFREAIITHTSEQLNIFKPIITTTGTSLEKNTAMQLTSQDEDVQVSTCHTDTYTHTH